MKSEGFKMLCRAVLFSALFLTLMFNVDARQRFLDTHREIVVLFASLLGLAAAWGWDCSNRQ